MHHVRHISIFISRDPDEVYEFAADPRNLPQWAAGLARSDVRQQGDAWVAEAPFGQVRIRFAAPNAFGVMDHEVELASGRVVRNPMRVMRSSGGSEFVFTLCRQPDMSDEQFAADALAVEADLQRLKGLLEQ